MTTLFDAKTGEVLTDNQAGVLAERFVETRARVTELMQELEAAAADARKAEAALVAAGFGADDSIQYGTQHVVGVEEDNAGRETVDKVVAEALQEELLGIGLGSITAPSFKPPTKGEVEKKRAELVKAGIAYRDLVPERVGTKRLNIQII